VKRKLLLIAAIVVALAAVAFARPGGGESYSGGGGHGGGGGGGGGGDAGAIFELIYWLLRLCIYYPQIMLPLLAIVIAYIAYSAWKQHQNKDWDSGPPRVERSASLDAIRPIDPEFSPVVFEDFAYRLFSTAHRARHTPETLATIAPYVSQEARDELARREPVGQPVAQVVIGAMRPYRVELDGMTSIAVEFEANLATAKQTRYSVEQWRFVRAAGVTSKPPDHARTFPCPNCGAPWQSSATGTQQCASCGQIVDNGRFDWLVEAVDVVSESERPPTLTTEVPERGTDLPTYKDRNVDGAWAELAAADPTVEDGSFGQRIALIHRELNAAWSHNDLAGVRGLVSDGMYDYLDYWVQAYKSQGLRNLMKDVRITRTDLAKVVRDKWYVAVTVRIWATGKDYVIEERSGKVVRGSKRRERPYSEYWTLIRSANRTAPAHTTKTCGNCGAPLTVNMAGACEHCGAHVTGGEFDWVLSKIEQDDSYRG
jgi:hypothetical protein